jgi:hypothetical protein
MEQVRNIIDNKLDSGLDQQLVLGILTKHMVRDKLSPTLAPVLCMEMINPIWRDRYQMVQSFEQSFHFEFYSRDRFIK